MPLKNLRLLFIASIRSLRHSRRFALLVIVTLTLPLAAVLFALHLLYQLLLAPLPYPQAEQLYLVRGQAYSGDKLNYANLMTAAGTAKLYQQQFYWSQLPTGQMPKTKAPEPAITQAALLAYATDVLRDRVDSPQLRIAYTSPEYFSLLQAPFVMGSSLASQTSATGAGSGAPAIDSSAPAEPEVVISNRLWHQLFAGSLELSKLHLQIGQQRFKVVGVLAADFVEPAILTPDQQTDLWLPWAFNPTYQQYRNWWGALVPDHHLLLRLKPEVNPELLAHQLSDLLNNEYLTQVRQSPYAAYFTDARIGVSLQPLQQVMQHNSRNFSHYLLGGCLILLLIALVNVSQLMLARLVSRQPQQAVELALGAQPVQLARQQTTEICLLLFLATSLASLLVAVALPWFQHAACGYLARLTELRLQAALLLSPLLLVPPIYLLNRLQARRWNYAMLQQQLQRSGKGSSGQQYRQARLLLFAHGVFATAILQLSLLLANSAWQRLQPVNGLNITGVQQLQLNVLSAGSTPLAVADLTAIRDLLDQQIASQHLTKQSDTAEHHAALGFSPILEFQGLSVQDSLQWSNAEPTAASLQVESNYTDHRFGALLQMPLLSGHWPDKKLLFQPKHLQLVINLSAARRLLQIRDTTDIPAVPLVTSQQIASQLAGQRLWFNGDTAADIVAVVADYQLPSLSPAEHADVPRAWISHFYHLLPSVYLRYPADVPALPVSTLNNLLASINPAFKVQQLYWLDDRLHSSQRLARLTLAVAFALSIVAVTLAATGIHSVYNYQLQLNQYQLGVRRALGATPPAILRLLLRQLLLPVLSGSAFATFAIFFAQLQLSPTEPHMLTAETITPLRAGLLFAAFSAVCFISLQQLNRRLHKVSVQSTLRNQ